MITNFKDHAENQNIYEARAQTIFDLYDKAGLIETALETRPCLQPNVGFLVDKLEYNRFTDTVMIYAGAWFGDEHDTYSVTVPANFLDQDPMTSLIFNEHLEKEQTCKQEKLFAKSAAGLAKQREQDLAELARLQAKLGITG